MRHKFAAQLYTLRNELSNDFAGILKDLKKMGWEAVQIDGYFGYSGKEIAKMLRETDLKTAGIHLSLDRLKNDLDNVLEDAELFGTKDLICPYLDDDMRNPAGFVKARQELFEIAKKVVPKGYRVGYHNHDFELKDYINGRVALDYILDNTDEISLYPEIDTYWVKKAGIDPLTYIKKYPSRMPILHLKDMTDDQRQTYAEIGTGSIDFLPILLWGEENGVEYYAVEQDICSGNPMDSLELSFTNLIKLSEKLPAI